LALDLSRFEDIDWDPEEQEDGNYQHCLRPGRLGPYPERVVDEVLSEEPVEFTMSSDRRVRDRWARQKYLLHVGRVVRHFPQAWRLPAAGDRLACHGERKAGLAQGPPSRRDG
jgi:hypothetical protein